LARTTGAEMVWAADPAWTLMPLGLVLMPKVAALMVRVLAPPTVTELLPAVVPAPVKVRLLMVVSAPRVVAPSPRDPYLRRLIPTARRPDCSTASVASSPHRPSAQGPARLVSM